MQVGELFVKMGVDMSGFRNDLDKTKRYVEDFGKQAESTFGRIKDAIKVGFGGALGFAGFEGIKQAISGIVTSTADFEQAMTKVKVLSGASADEIKKLGESAKELAPQMGFTAQQAAEALGNLAASGYDAKQMAEMLPAVLSAARASGEDLGLASELVSSQLQSFGMQAQQAGHVADVLAQAANISAIGLQDMNYSLKYAGPVAKSVGVSFEELSAAIAVMGNQGIKGEQAGTTLRGALLRLIDPPKEAKKALDALGVSISDQNGKMRPLADIIDQLRTKTKNLNDTQKDQIFSTIFGTEALSGMLALVNTGPDTLRKFTDELKNSDGASRQAAQAMQDNLAGAFNKFKGELTSAAMTLGNELSPGLKSAIESVTQFIKSLEDNGTIKKFGDTIKDVFGFIKDHGEEIKTALIGIGAGFSVFKGYEAIQKTVQAIKDLRLAIIALTTSNPILLAISVAVGAIALAAYEIYKNWGPIKDFFKETWQSIKDSVGNAAQWISNKWNDIKTSVSNAWNETKQTVVNSLESIYSHITAVFNRIGDLASDAVNWGKNILEGLWEGIKSASAWLRNLITSWTEDLKTHIRNLWIIKSPSRVTAEMGQYIAQGFAVGIQDGQDSVIASLDVLSKNMEARMKAITAQIETEQQRITDIQKKAAEEKQANDRISLENDLSNIQAQQEITKKQIELIRQKIAEYQKQQKDISSVQQELERQEQHLTELQQSESEKRQQLAEMETQAQISAAQARIEALQKEQQAIQQQKEIYDNFSSLVSSYTSEMSSAWDDYQKKVSEVNQNLSSDIQKANDDYQKAVEDRAKTLRDFVGLFDAITPKEVSGQSLLDNLRGQVATFEQWQANLAALSGRGIDKGLIDELRSMGPQAAAEIAALNTLTDAQLSEYVSLWRRKNEDAKQEATNELSDLAIQTQAKISELRSQAAAQLEQYKAEWTQKAQEIKDNTIQKLQELVQQAAEQGRDMVTRLANAITAAMPQLAQAMQGMPGFTSTGGTDQVKQAQEQQAGVVTAAVQQKQGVIDATIQTTQTVLQTWTDTNAQLSAKTEEIKTKLITSWQFIQQQLGALWQKMFADVTKTWNQIRGTLFDITNQIQVRFEGLVNAANRWGVSLMFNFIAGIQSQFSRLQETLLNMTMMVDSYMPHSPAKVGPLSRLDEWGPALVGTFADGIRNSLPKLENVTVRMAALSPAALGPSISNVTNNNNSRSISVSIGDISMGANIGDRRVLDNIYDYVMNKLQRELWKHGVRL